MYLQRAQWMSREQLIKIQTKGLRETVSHAFHKVPYYQRRFDGTIAVDGISEANDISKLPITTKTDFRETPIQTRTAIDADISRCELRSTSGTTGVPTTVLEDERSAAYREALNLRFLWNYGFRPLDRIARGQFLNAAAYSKRLAETRGLWGYLRRKTVRQHFLPDFKDQYSFLSSNKPDALIAFSSYCRGLAKYCQSIDRSLNFRIVVTSGETLDSVTRKLIEDTFQAEVFDHYGIEEVSGSIAWECPSHSGYHINAESMILEFLRNGQPVSAGEFGELCVTCFYKRATPIVRYCTGDIARRVDDECPCGRGLPMLREIQGRVLDYILTTNGRQISPHLVLNILTDVKGVQQLKVTQNRDLSIEVRIKTDMSESESIVQDVQQRCKGLFEETPLDVKLVDRIDTVGPKFRMVESQATL